MGNFNFYINVDQCLNMSNFDMFFYKLQSEHKFHLSNVQFYEDEGDDSLKSAFYGIRSYIDKRPFMVRDYRIIFGMRSELESRPAWKNTILYRLLKIYYGLLDAKIYIKSKDAADKNVSVIMLYDTDFTFEREQPGLASYDLAEDIASLMEYTDIHWQAGITEEELSGALAAFLDREKDRQGADSVTLRFVEDYLVWTYDVAVLETDSSFEEKEPVERLETPVRMSNVFYRMIGFATERVGHYCVFQKEINSNSLDQNLLALLSIVDYITSDLLPINEEDQRLTNETLKEQSRRSWERATNDGGIQVRYGRMIAGYKVRLQNALADMQKRVTDVVRGQPAPEYKHPMKLTGPKGLRAKDEEIYQGEFEDILQQFVKKSIDRRQAESAWKKTYQSLKEKMDHMEEELQAYAGELSKSYKRQLEERKTSRQGPEGREVYSQDDIGEKITLQSRKRKMILEQLKRPQMNPSLTFQDQLNLEHTLEQCNLEVTFFVKCHRMVKLMNFCLLILAGGGFFLLHYLLMQGYLFADVEKVSAALMYAGAVFVLFLCSWNAPYYYFKRKILRAMDSLREQMKVFIRGYFEKAENFTDYINAINELDAVNAYIGQLERMRAASVKKSREYLWHKVQVQEHIRKSGYFENLVYSLDIDDYAGIRGAGSQSGDSRLDVQKDVIHNRLYWPQSIQEGEHA